MVLRKIYQALERIEEKLEHITPCGETSPADGEWIQKGLDSIMGYQAGKKREDAE